MPLRIVKGADVATLWDSCVESFLDQLEGAVGPGSFDAHLWLTHRNLRDLLFERARARGLEGWLGLPFSFFSHLPLRFDIRQRPVGLLTRRRMVSRLAASVGADVMGRAPGRADGVIRGHMLDSLLSELLPEGIEPARLAAALDAVSRVPDGSGGDEFTMRRNRWLVTVYERYLAELAERDTYDDRAIHSMIASGVEAGGLLQAVGGARTLHVYGLYTPRHRQRLLASLSQQGEVDVVLYALDRPVPGEFDALARSSESLAAQPVQQATVQPAPDAAREIDWVVREVKTALRRGDCQPWQVAIVARSGAQDTRRVHRALERAGVPSTARVRTALSEIAALRTLRMLFRGAAADWDYSSLRRLLAHPYFDTGVQVRPIDHIAAQRRVVGLGNWREALEALSQRVDAGAPAREPGGAGLRAPRLHRDVEAFARLQQELAPLAAPRTEAGWLELCLELLRRDFLGMRSSVCQPAGGRWDVVRLDQRGVLQLERLLHEWLELDHRDVELDVGRWHTLLTRLLAAHELVLTTPMHKGVQVLEAHDAALIPFERVFVVHANDGEFPRAPGASTILSDEESRGLRSHGVALPDREQRLSRERALWDAVTRQRRGVAISYRTTSAGGTPLLPSMLVPDHDPDSELPRARAPREQDGGAAPAVTAEQADLLAVQGIARAMRGAEPHEPDRLTVACARPGWVDHALLAGVAEARRHRAGTILTDDHPSLSPNPWNGELRSPTVLAELADRFGPDRRWSASALEAYTRCPFVFLLERVLYIRDPAEADEETSALAFGSVAHDVLEAFYSGLIGRLPAALDGAAQQHLERVIDETLAHHEESGEWLGAPLLWAGTREQIRRAIGDYLRWELPYLAEKEEAPIEAEHRFGEGDQPLVVRGRDCTGRAVDMAVVGRIDRIDRTGKRKTVHDILDYKSGSSAPDRGGYDDGSTLQAALYLHVWAALGHPARKGRYRAVKRAGSPANSAETRIGRADYERALACAFSVPGRVRAGLFEPVKAYWNGGWQPWDVGAEVTRGRARLAKGRSRFDG